MSLNEHDDDDRAGSGDWPRWLWYAGAAADHLDRWLRLPGRGLVALLRLGRRTPPPSCSCPPASAMVSSRCEVHGPQLRGHIPE